MNTDLLIKYCNIQEVYIIFPSNLNRFNLVQTIECTLTAIKTQNWQQSDS